MKLSLPKLITVDDYHEFDSAKDLFKQIGLPVKVKEIGFLGGSYIGIVYEGNLTDLKVQKLIKQVRFVHSHMFLPRRRPKTRSTTNHFQSTY